MMALLPLTQANASQYQLGTSGVFVDISIDSATYGANSPIRVFASATNTEPMERTITMSAVTIGNSTINLFSPATVALSANGGSVIATPATLQAPSTACATACPYEVTFSAGLEELINHWISVGNVGGYTAFYGISRYDLNPLTVVVGAVPIYDSGYAEFITEPGTMDIHTVATMPEGESGRMVFTDSTGAVFCKDNSGADDYDFFGVVLNNTTPASIIVEAGKCN